MRFAHIADCHLGSWREQKLRELNMNSFRFAIDACITNKVEFLIIAGDLFNTSLPSVDVLKEVVRHLKNLKDNGIRVYAVAGSHDFSPSGKTMLDVLENAGLLVNVAKGRVNNGMLQLRFTIDKPTGVKITGLPGRKGLLEGSYYESLDRESLLKEQGIKIFVFHTALTEYKPKELQAVESLPLSFLPMGFDYYAGGHVHSKLIAQPKGYGFVVMPGPLYPNNFAELEKLRHGNMLLVEIDNNEIKPKELEVKLIDVLKVTVDCDKKAAEQVNLELSEAIDSLDVKNKLVLVRFSGVLDSGRVFDIDMNRAFNNLYSKGAYFVMRNTSELHSREFEQIRIAANPAEDIEVQLVNEHSSDLSVFKDEKAVIKELIALLSKSKVEGETNTDYEERILSEFDKLIGKHKNI